MVEAPLFLYHPDCFKRAYPESEVEEDLQFPELNSYIYEVSSESETPTEADTPSAWFNQFSDDEPLDEDIEEIELTPEEVEERRLRHGTWLPSRRSSPIPDYEIVNSLEWLTGNERQEVINQLGGESQVEQSPAETEELLLDLPIPDPSTYQQEQTSIDTSLLD